MDFMNDILGMISGTAQPTSMGINQGSMPQMSPDQWNNNPANFDANNAANPSVSSQGGGVAGLFADPNFQSFLAGTGAALDPDGVGGAVGKATQSMIQNKQMGKAMEKQDARWQSLMEALAGGKVSKATLKEDPKGGTTITLGAPEGGGLGALDQPIQPQTQPQAPPTFQDFMTSWTQKWGGQ